MTPEVRAAAATIEHADGDDRSARRDADHADRVVVGGDGAGDVGAVAVLVAAGRVAAEEGPAARGVDVEVGVRDMMPVSMTQAVAKLPATPPPTRAMPHGVS